MDANGVLSACYDQTNQALRVVGANEAFYIGSAQVNLFNSATIVRTNSWPRVQFADAATQSIDFTFQPPRWWSQMGIGFTWVNDSAASGNVRWRVAVKKEGIATGNISNAFDSDVSANIGAGSQNVPQFTIDHIANFNCVQDVFSSVYTVLIERIGADAGDTLAGAVSILDVVIRKNPVVP
jgi:hypothetical protein